EVARAAAVEEAASRIARRRVFCTGQQRAGVPAEQRLATDRNRVERCSVEGIPERKRLVTTGRDPRKLERHADRERAAGREEYLGQWIRCEPGELCGERDCRCIGVAPRRERKRVELLLDRLDDARMPVADLVHVVAVKI